MSMLFFVLKIATISARPTCDRAGAVVGEDPLRLPRKAISFGDSLAGYAWKLHMKQRRKAAPPVLQATERCTAA